MVRQILGHFALYTITLVTILGCGAREVALPEKAPRPVSVITLEETTPDKSFMASGTVSSWKTEQIGFEVGGRVKWVVEPGENVNGRVLDISRGDDTVLTDDAGSSSLEEDNGIPTATALAQLDPERYEVGVASAKANVEVSVRTASGIKIRIDELIPQDIKSAEANVDLAKIQFERSERLMSQNAVSQAEFDEARNRVQTTTAALNSLLATKNQAEAEWESAKAQTLSAKQNLKDAERDLQNTTLFGAYRGQISEVHVVPGSVVSAGTPVVTLQMMDPIRIEVELSAEQSREIRDRRQVPISFKSASGEVINGRGFVYLVDPSADPTTRTFTLTLLVRNETFRAPLHESLEGQVVARTQDIWPLSMSAIVGADGNLIEEQSILQDDEGSYIWIVANSLLEDSLPPVLEVTKKRVTVGGSRLPLLGKWFFRRVEFSDSEELDPRTIVAGALEFPEGGEDQWDGVHLFLDSGEQWMLRPGDLASVNLSGQDSLVGIYVPVSAIYEESGETYLFIAEDGKARKQRIDAQMPNNLDHGSIVRVTPVDGETLATGTQVVLGGVHFLQDGDAINVVEEVESR